MVLESWESRTVNYCHGRRWNTLPSSSGYFFSGAGWGRGGVLREFRFNFLIVLMLLFFDFMTIVAPVPSKGFDKMIVQTQM